MSLFQVRNFWSLDLEHIWNQLGNNIGVDSRRRAKQQYAGDNFAATSILAGGEIDTVVPSSGSFIVATGKFDAIGNYHVFVCGHIGGFLSLIQVPSSSQATGGDYCPTPLEDRQLLAAKQLNEPITDLKCGFFTSALKQSIVVLSIDHLKVFQVLLKPDSAATLIKSNDLMTGNPPLEADSDTMLSHEFEEIYQIDLLRDQVAAAVLVCDGHDSCLIRAEHDHRSEWTSDNPPGNSETTSMSSAKLHLPQRDRIVVQYANQFLTTLIEHKKVIGHFEWRFTSTDSGIESGAGDTKPMQQQMAEYVGAMPMAYLRSRSSNDLLVSLSDQRIYCVPLDQLLARARRNVLRRVTQNLLAASYQAVLPTELGSCEVPASCFDVSKQEAGTIAIDLSERSSIRWHFDCLFAPLQLRTVLRSKRETPTATGTGKEATMDDAGQSQVLVLTRYTLDLISASGEHLWSQRFETALTCMYAYTIESQPSKATDKRLDDRASGNCDGCSLITVVCTDSFGGATDKSSLVFMKEDLIEWSATLNAKPLEIWRVDLSKMSGYLTCLDVKHNNLLVSYLGTNAEADDLLLTDESEESQPARPGDSSRLQQFEAIDEPLDSDGDCDEDGDDELEYGTDKEQEDISKEGTVGGRHLRVECKLEACNQWPEVSVNCVVRIQSESANVIHNIVAILEHDELIRFEPSSTTSSDKDSSSNKPSRGAWTDIGPGALQVQLGSCWPDRREPVSFGGTFSRKRGLSSDGRAIFEDSLPKSLRVRLTLYYNMIVRPIGQHVQEEYILLPLTMIGRLDQIDYSSGQDQSLVDVLNNLEPFRCKQSDKDESKLIDSRGFYICDLFMSHCGAESDESDCQGLQSSTANIYMQLLDRIIEADLLCRGRQFDCLYGAPLVINRMGKDSKADDLIAYTLESINLLAQSLDCRLKYRSSPSFANQSTMSILRQTSEDSAAPIIFSVGFSLPNSRARMRIEHDEPETNESQGDRMVLVWLHVCDITTSCSEVSKEFVRIHSENWFVRQTRGEQLEQQIKVRCKQQSNVLLVFEGNDPVSIMFLLEHFIERLELDFKLTRLDYMCQLSCERLLAETRHEAGEAQKDEYGCPLQLPTNLIVVNNKLADYVRSLQQQVGRLNSDYKRCKEEVELEYCKFQLCTTASLSLAKRLSNLPENTNRQFAGINQLVRDYCSKLNRLLGEIDQLKRELDCYSKIPKFRELIAQTGDK